MYNKADLLSLQIIQNNYKGGKNSFVQYTNYVIDPGRGKIINEKTFLFLTMIRCLPLSLLTK